VGTARTPKPRPAATAALTLLTALTALAALALVASMLAACTSGSPSTSGPASASQSTAQTVTACRRHPAAPRLHGPAQSGPAQAGGAGGIVWAVLLNRCQGTAEFPLWGTNATSSQQAGALVPGDRLVLVQDGTVSMFSARTGARLWQRMLDPATDQPSVQDLEVSASLVLVSLQTANGAPRISFLATGTGQPAGPVNGGPPGEPFLAGAHVVLTDGKDLLHGYDPATQSVTWKDTVPNAPGNGGALHDGSTVYLSSVPPSGVTGTMFQRKILRIDAANGHRLPPLRLPRRLNVDPELAGGNGYAQGLLLLDVIGSKATKNAQGQIGESFTSTIALNPATGRTAWTARGQVAGQPSGPFTELDYTAHSYTAVNPRTGRTLWTITNPGFGTTGGPNPVQAQPGAALTAGIATGGADGNIAALRPGSGPGQRLWSSPPLPSPLFLGASGSTVFVTVCQPWPGSQPNLCAYQQLVAIAG
jgi:hypothetical protein